MCNIINAIKISLARFIIHKLSDAADDFQRRRPEK